MKDKDIENLRNTLIKQTGEADAIRLGKIERYISFLRIDAQCDNEIKRDGTSIKIENGSQSFTKQHPAIETKLSIQKELEKLENSLGITFVTPSPSASSVEDKQESKGASLL